MSAIALYQNQLHFLVQGTNLRRDGEGELSSFEISFSRHWEFFSSLGVFRYGETFRRSLSGDNSLSQVFQFISNNLRTGRIV